MSKIKSITARQLIDCKCRPMVEVDVVTEDGYIGRGSAPTGSSVGVHESYVLRDHDPKEYDGLSVHKAVENVKNIIAPALIGMDVKDLRAIDRKMIEMDGTPNKGKLGGNAIYSTSIAAFRAAAEEEHVPAYQYLCGRNIKTVPVPSFNVINGGKYGDITMAFNEFLIVPYKAESIYEAVEIAVKCFQELENVIRDYSKNAAQIGRSYGWATPTDDPEAALELMQRAVDRCGYHEKVAFALDCASSAMFDKKTKTYLMKGKQITAEEMIAYARGLTQKFSFVFIEDLLDEDAWEYYPMAVKELSNTIILGDDFIVTNPERLRKAYEQKAVEGFILKPNQVGTLTEALDAYRYGHERGMYAIPSGRAGGVVGDVVMDLSLGLEVPFQKNGAPRSGERIDKLNVLMRACDTAPDCRMKDLSGIVKFS